MGGDHGRDARDSVGLSDTAIGVCPGSGPGRRKAIGLMFLVCGEALYDLFQADAAADGGVTFEARPGGSPFNVAVGMARLGARAALLTGISEDLLGSRLTMLLETERVATGYLVRSGRRTTLSVVGLDAAGGPSYAFYGVGSADCSLTGADLPQLDGTISGLHFGSYSTVVAPVADAFADLAEREAHRFISFDPNVRLAIEPDRALWQRRVSHLRRRAHLVKASQEDIEALHPGEDPEAVIRSWALDGPALVVMTRGAAEILAFRGTDEIRLTPPKIDVLDTVGAGDSFQAALLARLSAQAEPAKYLEALSREAVIGLLGEAARAAAMTCTRRGANLPTAADLRETESA